jgi:hypothetical protein
MNFNNQKSNYLNTLSIIKFGVFRKTPYLIVIPQIRQ